MRVVFYFILFIYLFICVICVICKGRGLISYLKYAAHAEYLGSEAEEGGKKG